MSHITLDPNLSKQLREFTEAVELREPSGRVLGRFVPLPDMTDWVPVSPDVSEEELDRRERETDSYSTAEVLAHLENLQCPKSDGSAQR